MQTHHLCSQNKSEREKKSHHKHKASKIQRSHPQYNMNTYEMNQIGMDQMDMMDMNMGMNQIGANNQFGFQQHSRHHSIVHQQHHQRHFGTPAVPSYTIPIVTAVPVESNTDTDYVYTVPPPTITQEQIHSHTIYPESIQNSSTRRATRKGNGIGRIVNSLQRKRGRMMQRRLQRGLNIASSLA